MISGNNFPNMNCIAVIGYKLQNGDMVFLFFHLVLIIFSFFLCFFPLFLFFPLFFLFFFCFFSFFFFIFFFFSFFFFFFLFFSFFFFFFLFFSFFFFFFLFFSFFFFFFLFFSLGFRASGITCIWFSIEKMFLDVKNLFFSLFFFFFLFFYLFFFFFFFLTKKRKNMKHNENICLFFEKKRKSYTCCKGVPGAMCCGKLYDSLRFGGILDPSVVSCALSFWIPVCVFSQWSFGPYGQTSSRSRHDARNESFPCLHVWSGLCIACPYPC